MKPGSMPDKPFSGDPPPNGPPLGKPFFRKSSRRPSGLVLGIGIILIGVVHLLKQIHGHSKVLDFAIGLWPLILVAMGASRLRTSKDRHPALGWVLIVLGSILLMATLGKDGLDGLIGPALVVGVGVYLILRALRKRRPGPQPPVPSQDHVRCTAILSGFKNRIHSRAFQGGELTAIFGGFEMDLTPAAMQNPTARLDVFVLLGGGEIQVPEDWDVSIEVTAIAGGVGDKTPAPITDRPRPRLIVTGMVLFGGIEIHH